MAMALVQNKSKSFYNHYNSTVLIWKFSDLTAQTIGQMEVMDLLIFFHYIWTLLDNILI